MKKRLLSMLLTLCIALCTLPTVSVFAETSDNYIYLSEMEYLPESKVGYDKIKKDENIEGGKISVYLDGAATFFDRGMAAHATSALYYDLSNYSDYTRFSAYLGINSTKNAGNGVNFVISVSDDMSNWKEVYRIDEMLPGQDAVYVDIDLGGAKYLQLYSDNLGNATQDHSVYADARLLTSSYDISTEISAKFEKVSVYDEQIIESYSELDKDADLTDELKKLLLLRTFVKRYGYYTIQQTADKSDEIKEAVNYIYDNEKVLNYFVLGGVKDRSNGSYLDALNAWCDLYNAYKADFDPNAEIGTDGDMYLRMAVSMSIAYARSLNYWPGSARNSVPTERYAEFKYLIENGYFDRVEGWSKAQFAKLPIELMRLVVNTEMHEDEFVWLADLAKETYNDNSRKYLDAYRFITYTFLDDYNYTSASYPQYYDTANYDKYNEKWKLDEIYLKSDQNGDKTPLVPFGTDKHPRLWMMFDAGSVCGGLAGTYEVLHEVHGLPAELINQPGHAATFVYSENENGYGIWSIENDVSGWKQSQDYNTFYPLGWEARNTAEYGYDGSFILLAQRALNEYDKLENAMYYKYLADVFIDAENTDVLADIYKKQLSIQPYNYDAVMGVTDLYIANSDTTADEYMDLAKYIVEQFTYYPLPMLDMLKCIEPYVQEDYKLQFDTLRKTALEKAAAATENESIQSAAVKAVANYYLGNETEPFTFSFDGENAGKIMLDESYANSSVTWCYTLGGIDLLDETLNPEKEGVVTVQASEKALSAEELNSISAENDICIYMVGANSTIYTIDITSAAAPTQKTLYANDWENRFAGSTDSLEWCETGSGNWSNYTPSTVFDGNRNISVRYKANGTMLSSDSADYVFTADTDTPQKKYVPISAISLHSYSSQNSNTDAAIHLIDGNMNTRWHNKYAGEEDRYYAVEFDKERYITEIEYYPDESGWNGQFRSGEIYITTADSDEWVLADSFTDLEQTKTVHIISLQQPTKCKKLKIVLTQTYGQTENQANRFACGRMLNFYEDITKTAGWNIESYNGETLVIDKFSDALAGQKIFAVIAQYASIDDTLYLSECEIIEIPVETDKNRYELPVNRNLMSGGNKQVKIMLWDKNMKPLADIKCY